MDAEIAGNYDSDSNGTLNNFGTFWYISLPFSAKQQREMTKFKVLLKT